MADEISSDVDVELGEDYFITLDYDDGTSEECTSMGTARRTTVVSTCWSWTSPCSTT